MKKKILKRLAIVVAVIAVFLFLSSTLLKVQLKRTMFQGWTPEMKAQYTSWLNDPVDVSEALKIRPPSDETVAAACAFAEAFEVARGADNEVFDLALKYKDFARSGWHGEESPVEMGQLEEKITKYAPALAAFEALVRRPDYVIDSNRPCGEPDANGMAPRPNFLIIQTAVKLLGIRSRVEASKGDFDSALRTSELMVRATRTNRHSWMITNLIGIAVLAIASNNWHAIVEVCDDAPRIRQSLNAITEQSGGIYFFPPEIPIVALDTVGQLVSFRLGGMNIEMENKSTSELHAIKLLIYAEAIEAHRLPTLKVGSPEYQQARAHTREYKRAEFWIDPKRGGWKARLIPRTLLEYNRAKLYSIAIPNFLEATTREASALAKLDLARIEAAKRVYKLESVQAAPSIEALVPEYLPEALVDRFDESGGGYGWEPVVYSIGPDRIDNKATVQYDPTNGTISRGDIFFPVMN